VKPGATTAPWRVTRRQASKAYVSLAVLNAGQAAIFTTGLAAVMVMCAYGIKDGSYNRRRPW